MTTLKDIAEKLNGNYWEKYGYKRVYLDRGYNTNKMSTKTFVWQNENDEFVVSCRIECPSQPFEWIDSQQEEIKENVYEEIEEVLAKTVFLIQDNETKLFNGLTFDEFEEINNCTNYFLSEDKAKEYLEEEIEGSNFAQGKSFSIVEMDKEKFNKIIEKWWTKRKKEVEEEDKKAEIKAKKEEKEKSEKLKDHENKKDISGDSEEFGIGSIVSHKRFGEGKVLKENETKIEIDFSGETKSLLKRFVNLKLVKK